MIELIKNLIAIPSMSGNETLIQSFIFEWLSDRGLEPISVQGNTVVMIPGLDRRKAFVCNAHVDTVDPGSLSLWDHDPFDPWTEGDKLYGIGASDEKAGVALCLELAEKYVHDQPPCDVWMMFVNQEETTGDGSRVCINWFVTEKMARYAHVAGVLCEPTGLVSIEIGHKGNVFVKLTVTGKSGHGSDPHAVAPHATLVMAEILLSLKQLEETWTKYHDPTLGSPTIAAGTSIVSGSAGSPNKIADTCVATLDIRTTPKSHERVLQELRAFLRKLPVTVEYLFPPISYGLTDTKSVLVTTCQTTFPTIALQISKASTDLVFFGQYGIPAIIFGPGEKESMHAANEYCIPSKIDMGVQMYQQLITNWSNNLATN